MRTPTPPPPGPPDPTPPELGPRYPQPQPQPPPGATPIEGRVEKTQCTLKEFARLTEISQKQCPILLFRVRDPGPNDPTHILVLSGVELAGSHGVQTWASAQELHGYTNDYREAIIDGLILSRLPSGSRVGIIGYSFGGIAGQNLSSPNFPADRRAYNDLKLSFPYVVTFGAPIPAFENPSTRYVHVEVEGNGDPVLRYVREFLPTSLLPHQVGPNHRVIQLRGGYSPFDTHWNNHFIYWTSDELARYGVEGLGIPCPDIDYDSVLAYPVPRFRKREAGEPPSFSGLKSVDEDVHSIGSWSEYWENADDSMKIKYSEEIGIAGMEAEARKHGYTELLSPDAENRTTARQGLDGLYLDKGVLVVAEAKGVGLSGDPKDLDEILKDGYGHRQGSILWAQGAAQRMAKSYPMRPYPDDPRERMSPGQLEAERREKAAAEQVLAALRSCGRIRVRVEAFVTEHMNGVPVRTKHYVTDRYPPVVEAGDPDFVGIGDILHPRGP